MRQPRSRLREAVDMRGLDVGCAVTSEIAVAYVVCDDQDDVRPRRGGLSVERGEPESADRGEQDKSAHESSLTAESYTTRGVTGAKRCARRATSRSWCQGLWCCSRNSIFRS